MTSSFGVSLDFVVTRHTRVELLTTEEEEGQEGAGSRQKADLWLARRL